MQCSQDRLWSQYDPDQDKVFAEDEWVNEVRHGSTPAKEEMQSVFLIPTSRAILLITLWVIISNDGL